MPLPEVYQRPSTLAAALAYLQQPGTVAFSGGGLLLAGVEVPFRQVVDLQAIPELNHLTPGATTIDIGGAVTLAALVNSPALPALLRTALTRTLPVNRCSGISVGEALSASRPPAEWLVALAALGAQVAHTGFTPGEAAPPLLPVETFIAQRAQHPGPYRGIITGLHLPRLADGTGTGAAHVARTPADLPIVCAAAVRQPPGLQPRLKLALHGVSPLPVLALLLPLEGAPDAALPAVLEQVARAIQPVSDDQGSAAYRAAMAAVMVRRALAQAQSAAGGL
ncbi:MAG: FAD binding domain-containing protein [Anaerolineae bacterium]|jgi:carbon-monoxide dehydrogenase medium subunit|nr:FAD binding domain-containing protein [Anaerolineae bacterium]